MKLAQQCQATLSMTVQALDSSAGLMTSEECHSEFNRLNFEPAFIEVHQPDDGLGFLALGFTGVPGIEDAPDFVQGLDRKKPGQMVFRQRSSGPVERIDSEAATRISYTITCAGFAFLALRFDGVPVIQGAQDFVQALDSIAGLNSAEISPYFIAGFRF